MTHSHKLVNSVLKCFEMQKYISYHDLKKKKLKWIYPFDEPNFSGNRYWPSYNTNGQYHPLVKKVKSWIFTSSVTLDKEIKKFYNVKRRLVLQRFLIIYCVEKKNEYQVVISPLIMQTNCSKLTCSKTRSYSNII